MLVRIPGVKATKYMMASAAKINSGIASMVKDWVVDSERCTRIVHGISGRVRKNAKPEMAMAKATGIPRNKIIKKNPIAPNINSPPISRPVS